MKADHGKARPNFRYCPPTDIERAAGGVLEDELHRGKRLVRRLMWGVVLLGAWFCLFTVWLIKATKSLQ